MFNHYFSFFLILCILTTTAFSADHDYEIPEKNALVTRLLGHRRMPTEVREQIQQDSKNLASKQITEIQARVDDVISRAIDLKHNLDEMRDDQLNLENLYPYDETIHALTACYIALVDVMQLNNQSQDKRKISTILNLIAQYTYLSQEHEYRLFDAFFMTDNGLDHEKCRQVWLDHNPSAISILFEGAESYDEFTKRLFGVPIDNFVALIRKKSDPDKEPTLQQGWKLHVSAKSDSALKVATIVLPLLAQHNFAHKIIGSNAFLERLNKDVTQQGKFITIYPESDVQALQIAILLDEKLSSPDLTPEHFIRVPGELQLGKTGGLSARYGAFAGHLIAVLDDNGEPIMENGQTKMTLDERGAAYKPDFIKQHPFGKLVEPRLVRRDAQRQIVSPSSSKNS
ncbi:MAG: hypothetical protein KF820_06035 [Candidatus Paracaedibacteraceae bacterium]|nr:hypothetical protein [Candidatus Paracaedibacteraceae bacterium]